MGLPMLRGLTPEIGLVGTNVPGMPGSGVPLPFVGLNEPVPVPGQGLDFGALMGALAQGIGGPQQQQPMMAPPAPVFAQRSGSGINLAALGIRPGGGAPTLTPGQQALLQGLRGL